MTMHEGNIVSILPWSRKGYHGGGLDCVNDQAI